MIEGSGCRARRGLECWTESGLFESIECVAVVGLDEIGLMKLKVLWEEFDLRILTSSTLLTKKFGSLKLNGRSCR